MKNSEAASKSCLPIAAVILAAGAATRMGRLKQVLPFRGRTLIENAGAACSGAGFEPILVVVGAECETVRSSIAAQRVVVVGNPQWERGMGSSISVALRCLRELATDSAAVAIVLADQPLVNAGHLRAMRRLFSRSSGATVAAKYNDTLGVPAIFRRSLFGTLESLPPEVGARALLRDPRQPVVSFELPEAAVDIDTPEDFEKLIATV